MDNVIYPGNKYTSCGQFLVRGNSFEDVCAYKDIWLLTLHQSDGVVAGSAVDRKPLTAASDLMLPGRCFFSDSNRRTCLCHRLLVLPCHRQP